MPTAPLVLHALQAAQAAEAVPALPAAPHDRGEIYVDVPADYPGCRPAKPVRIPDWVRRLRDAAPR